MTPCSWKLIFGQWFVNVSFKNKNEAYDSIKTLWICHEKIYTVESRSLRQYIWMLCKFSFYVSMISNDKFS